MNKIVPIGIVALAIVFVVEFPADANQTKKVSLKARVADLEQAVSYLRTRLKDLESSGRRDIERLSERL